VREFLAAGRLKHAARVLDLGCGEGKNAFAFADAGAVVTAVDCSAEALQHAERLQHRNISWVHADCRDFLSLQHKHFDIVLMYGLLHCLATEAEIAAVVAKALSITLPNGVHIVVAFNNGPHDLSAHPNFNPTLASHDFYLTLYASCRVLHAASSLLYETHPHNQIPHFHSLTRIMAERSI